MNINKEDEFPSLKPRDEIKSHSKRTRSASRRSSISSMSTTSIGLERRTEKRTWQFTLENAVCRRFLFCKCRNCSKNHIGFTKKNWNDLSRFPCNKAMKVSVGTEVKVIHVKPYGNSGDVRAYVKYLICDDDFEEVEPEYFKGWVHPDCVNVVAVHATKFQKKRKRVARPVFAQEEEAFFVDETPKFRFHEKVLCRISSSSPWMAGDVVTVRPLTVRPESWEKALPWEIENLEKFPQSKFIAVQNMPVRVNERTESGVKTTLPKGTNLGFVEMKGFEGRINEPVCGWVTMRDDHQLNVLEENYVSDRRIYPTVYLSNLPASSTFGSIAQAVRDLGQGFSTIPKNIETHTMEDGRVFGTVSFSVAAGGKKLVNKALTIDGQEVYCSWCVHYLRFKAKQDLLRKESAI